MPIPSLNSFQDRNDEAQWAAQPCQRSVLRLGEVGVAVVALVKFALFAALYCVGGVAAEVFRVARRTTELL